jgi:hypothetical protein
LLLIRQRVATDVRGAFRELPLDELIALLEDSGLDLPLLERVAELPYSSSVGRPWFASATNSQIPPAR